MANPVDINAPGGIGLHFDTKIVSPRHVIRDVLNQSSPPPPVERDTDSPRTAGGIVLAMQMLDDTVVQLERAVNELRARLDPVIAPSATGPEGCGFDHGECSSLANAVFARAERLSCLLGAVRHMTGVVDL